LLEALGEKSAIVARSDQPAAAPKSFRVSAGVIEALIPF
jgi:hypothetical protein